MKKTISLLVLIAVLLCVFVSCSKFGEDPYAYAEELENKGFYVEVFDRSTYSGLVMIYEIGADFDLESAAMINYIVFCENEEEGYFFYCTNEKSAQELEQDLNDLSSYSDVVIKRQGKIVYCGASENWAGI